MDKSKAMKVMEEENNRYRDLINQIMSIMSHPFSKTWNKDKALYRIDSILKNYAEKLEGNQNEN